MRTDPLPNEDYIHFFDHVLVFQRTALYQISLRPYHEHLLDYKASCTIQGQYSSGKPCGPHGRCGQGGDKEKTPKARNNFLPNASDLRLVRPV